MSPHLFKFFLWCALWIALAWGGNIAIQRERELKNIQAKKAADERAVQAQEKEKLREAELKEKIAGLNDELGRKLGAEVSAAFKHPGYGLKQAIAAAARRSAPTNCAVDVSVDRFTEFAVTISRDAPLSTNEMAVVAQKLLPHAAQYLHAIRFAQTNNVIAELDRQDIEFIDDWSRASVERIAMLLPREQEPPAGTIEADRFKRDRQLAEMAQSDPQLSDKLVKAQESFFAAGRAADEALRKAIDGSNQALNLADDLKPNYVKRRDALREAEASAKIAREFWANPAAAWRKALETHNVPGQAIAALEPMVNDLLKRDDAKATAAMDALDAKLESGRFFLQRLEDEGRPGRDTLVVDAPKRIERALEQLRADVKALDEALRAWNESREK